MKNVNFEVYTENGILTGYSELDGLIGNLSAGDFVVISSQPSAGKTTFCLSLVKNITLQHKIASAFFSLEMPAADLSKRLLSQVDNDTELVAASPFYIIDTVNMNLGQIKESIREMVDKNHIKIVFIDYLELISSPEDDELLENLKSLALEFEIILVALKQLNRAFVPESFIEEECFRKNADIILLLHCEKNNQQAGCPENLFLELSVAKNRTGGKNGLVKIPPLRTK